ncbi:MAG: U32 family peptidase [Clostridia bacterium]|nr:U32 family peptidase [Clostridia bacterium]
MTDRDKNGLPELLAPAGSPAALRAAVDAGADAVYLGATAFNARANAANFTEKELNDCIAYAHEKGVRVFVTLNTLIYDRELKDFLKTAESARNAGADAFIIADTGAISVLRKTMPDMPLHGSTQMSVHSSGAADALKTLGISRVVLARELSYTNIRSFNEKVHDIETEIFIHGALCVCHSGQCLFSSVVGGRSGNRGECAQPCRLPYKVRGKEAYPLSLKDLCLAGHISEILDSGVSSLKIEGRMKSPAYVYSVVSVYRTLLDERRNATKEELDFLAAVFSRNGFTDAYFSGKPDGNMLGTRSEKQKEASVPPLPASVKNHGYTEKTPITKSGASFSSAPAPERFPAVPGRQSNFRSAILYNNNQLTEKVRAYFRLCYIPLEHYADAVKRGIAPRGILMPPVITDSELPEIRKMLNEAVSCGATDVLDGNIGHLPLLKETGLRTHGDFRLNICNSGSAAFAKELGYSDYILSPELTLPRIRDIGGPASVITYGRIPLMITEKCAGSECGSCSLCDKGRNKLTDRIGADFPVIRTYSHRSLIFNSVPIYMADKPEQLKSSGINSTVAVFSTESAAEADSITDAIKNGRPYPLGRDGSVRRIKQK